MMWRLQQEQFQLPTRLPVLRQAYIFSAIDFVMHIVFLFVITDVVGMAVLLGNVAICSPIDPAIFLCLLLMMFLFSSLSVDWVHRSCLCVATLGTEAAISFLANKNEPIGFQIAHCCVFVSFDSFHRGVGVQLAS